MNGVSTLVGAVEEEVVGPDDAKRAATPDSCQSAERMRSQVVA